LVCVNDPNVATVEVVEQFKVLSGSHVPCPDDFLGVNVGRVENPLSVWIMDSGLLPHEDEVLTG